MPYLVVDQRVADVRDWAAAFHAATEQRRAHGAHEATVLTDPTDPGRLLVVVRFDTAEQASAWRARPGVDQEMARVGVDPASVVVRVLDELLPGAAVG